MDIDAFESSLTADVPDQALSPLLQSLWWDAKGDWDQAHQIAQDVHSKMGSLVHAYLHRKEGDIGNAGYWYSRANRPMYNGALEQEWTAIVTELMAMECGD